MTTGQRLFCMEFLCFNTLPCRHMPLLAHPGRKETGRRGFPSKGRGSPMGSFARMTVLLLLPFYCYYCHSTNGIQLLPCYYCHSTNITVLLLLPFYYVRITTTARRDCIFLGLAQGVASWGGGFKVLYYD